MMRLGITTSLLSALLVAPTLQADPTHQSVRYATQIVVGGQHGWAHDEGNASGIFHTFDALDLPGTMRRARKVHVFLPRSYGQGSQRYPVVYFNDGTTTFFPDGGGPTWALADQLSELYRTRAIPEVIAVGIKPTDRDKEYTHAPVPSRGTCCELEDYADYVATQLKPWIDHNYRTKSERSKTTIAGSSHGGLAAFVTAAMHPDVFGQAICMSSSFWVDTIPFGPTYSLRDSALVNRLAARLRGNVKPRLWLDWGLVRSGGSHNSLIEANASSRSKELRDLLTSDFGYHLASNLMTVEDPSGEHNEASWSRRLRQALPWAVGSRYPR